MSSIFRELGRRSAGSVPDRLLPAAAVVVALILVVATFGTDPTTVVGLLALALAVATVYSAVEIVNAYEKRALTVFG